MIILNLRCGSVLTVFLHLAEQPAQRIGNSIGELILMQKVSDQTSKELQILVITEREGMRQDQCGKETKQREKAVMTKENGSDPDAPEQLKEGYQQDGPCQSERPGKSLTRQIAGPQLHQQGGYAIDNGAEHRQRRHHHGIEERSQQRAVELTAIFLGNSRRLHVRIGSTPPGTQVIESRQFGSVRTRIGR